MIRPQLRNAVWRIFTVDAQMLTFLLLADSAAAFNTAARTQFSITTAGRALPSPSIAMAASDADVCPPRLPTFGLSEREQIRFRYMMLRSEPLPHEIFGLQVLLGVIGTHLAGFIGFIFGSCQLAPCVSWLPGTVGDKFRATGWLTFSSVRSACMWTSSVWRETGLQVRHTARTRTLASHSFSSAHRPLIHLRWQAARSRLIEVCRRFDSETAARAKAGAASSALLRSLMGAFTATLGALSATLGAVQSVRQRRLASLKV